MTKTAALALAACLALPTLARADHVPEPPTIRVSGEATVQEKPDQAEVEVGVTTTAKRSGEATSENAERTQAVIAALKKVLGAKAEITTTGYSLQPNQEWPKEGGTPTITGYTASNVVRARTGELGEVGSVIDAALEAGANQVQGLRFTLRDEAAAKSRAIALAARRAMAKAEALAGALRVKLGRIRTAEESAAPGPPIAFRGMSVAELESASAPTPIESGDLDVTATVRLAIEIEK